MNVKIFLVIINILLISSCAPLSNNGSARPLGKGKSDLQGGTIGGIWPYLRYGYGLSDKMDGGFVYEVTNFGLWAKYVTYQDKTNSLAIDIGIGSHSNIDYESSNYFNLGVNFSQLYDKFEPYYAGRINIISEEDVYLQGTVGAHWWFSKQFGIKAHVDTFIFDDEDVGMYPPWSFGLGLSYRF